MRPTINIHGAILQSHRLFAPLSEQELLLLLKNAKTVSFNKGDALFQQDEMAEHFYFIIQGKMKLFRRLHDGSEKVVLVLQENQPFAHAAIFKQNPSYPLCARALTSLEVLKFKNADYLSLLQKNNNLALALLSNMSDHISEMIDDIEVLSLKSSSLRVIHYFRTLHQMSDNKNNIKLPAAKNVIASQLAIKPETFSRILHRLQDKGLIEINGSNITLLDMNQLQTYNPNDNHSTPAHELAMQG